MEKPREWLYTSDEKWLEKLDWKSIDPSDLKAFVLDG